MAFTPPVNPARLHIEVGGGTGHGPTEIAAFDAALRTIGVGNYNLIRLSSVIPAGSQVTAPPKPLTPPGQWGDRLYVVYAEQRTGLVGDQAWAGVGWIQDPHLGHGLFVEHEGRSEAKVRSDVELSLASLRQGRGAAGDSLGEAQIITSGLTCTDQPVCALVVAVFAAQPWPDHEGQSC